MFLKLKNLICCAAIFLGGSQYSAIAQAEKVSPDQVYRELSEWLSKVESVQYVLKEYSEINPATYLSLVYRESGTFFYCETKIVSSEADRVFRGNIVSWDGDRGMRLRQDTGLLYVNSKPYRLPNEFRNLNVLWSPFRFCSKISDNSESRYPSLSLIKENILKKNVEGLSDIKKVKDDISITVDGGIDLMDGLPVSVTTVFSAEKGFYPLRWELYNSDKKLKSRHTVENLQSYQVPGTALKIPYPARIRSTYYKTNGEESNNVIGEYSDVIFNEKEHPLFEVDPALAQKIVDEVNGNKVITIPK